ncbi:MAG: hypothetical protein HYX72_13330 [Acidobacteria bacterium]|nr:hypothetical protein [Acidobacteriota bacterium]
MDAERSSILISLAIRALTPDQQHIIKHRFAIDGVRCMTLQAIALDSGVTRERIRQREGKALERLKNILKTAIPGSGGSPTEMPECLDIGVRALNALKRTDARGLKPIETVGQLTTQSRRELLKRPALGKQSVKLITEALQKMGLRLARDWASEYYPNGLGHEDQEALESFYLEALQKLFLKLSPPRRTEALHRLSELLHSDPRAFS